MKPKPMHEIATTNVEVPTVSVRTLKGDGASREAICIQWFGTAELQLPNGAQFYFEPLTDKNSPRWYGEPEAFKVAFIGPVRDWPRREVVQQVADSMTEGNLDGYVAWFVSGKFPEPHPTAVLVVASIATRVVLLGDPNVGVIRPLSYDGAAELKVEDEKVRAQMTLAEQLQANPDMKLPPDAVPWATSWDECTVCEAFHNSCDTKPAVPHRGSCNDLVHLCTACGRRWWQYNDHYHLWKHVTSEQEWDAVRRQSILMKAGLLIEQ